MTHPTIKAIAEAICRAESEAVALANEYLERNQPIIEQSPDDLLESVRQQSS